MADSALGLEDALIARQEVAAIDRAVSQLPRQLKEPLLLTALDGLSQQQAAEMLGVSVKAIETRVYRARQRLAAVLDSVSERRAERS